jgi:hypothetical protein
LSKQQHQNAQEGKGNSLQRPVRNVDKNVTLQEQELLLKPDLPTDQLAAMPDHPGTRPLRRQAILQLQKSHGNAYVMRQVMPRLQRQDDHQAPIGAGEGDGQQEISNGGSIVRVTPGTVEISGGIVNVDAAMTNVNGLLKTNTLMADSVIASSYTPGAGNIW